LGQDCQRVFKKIDSEKRGEVIKNETKPHGGLGTKKKKERKKGAGGPFQLHAVD